MSLHRHHHRHHDALTHSLLVAKKPQPQHPQPHSSSSSSLHYSSSLLIRLFLVSMFVGVAGFQIGLFVGSNNTSNNIRRHAAVVVPCQCECHRSDDQRNNTVSSTVRGRGGGDQSRMGTMWNRTDQIYSYESETLPLSLKSSSFANSNLPSFVGGTARVDRNEFISQFDLGVPWDATTEYNREVLILYIGNASMPAVETRTSQDDDGGVGVGVGVSSPSSLLSVRDATSNCNELKLVLLEHANTGQQEQGQQQQQQQQQQCLALINQWESHHLYKWIRRQSINQQQTNESEGDDWIDAAADDGHDNDDDSYSEEDLTSPDSTGNDDDVSTESVADTNMKNSLEFVARDRTVLDDNRRRFWPDNSATSNYWKVLVEYLEQLESTLNRL